jgi:basic membrane protein A and related proteins
LETMLPRRAFIVGPAVMLGGVATGLLPTRGIAANGPVRLAMVTDVGGLGDRSFNDSAYRGLKDAQTQLHAEITVLQSRSAADYQPNLTVLANKGYDLTYAIGFLMARDTEEVASRFPQRRFAIIDAVVPQPNVASVTFQEEQGSFLAGAAAAMVSKTKTIAFLGGMDIPLLRKFEAGYTAGARQINPSVRVLVKYVGSFEDVAAGKELSGVLFGQQADIIYAAAGKAGLGTIDLVKTKPNAYVIGVDSDQDALAPGKILTSMVKHVDVAVLRLAREAAAGRPPSGHVILGLRENAVGLTGFAYTRSALTPAQFHTIDLLRTAIIAGKIVPPTTRDELARFHPVPLAR